MDTRNKLLQTIQIRPLSVDDYEAVLQWSKDDAFCAANDWEFNRSPEELYRWWRGCVNNTDEDFLRIGIEVEEKLIGYADLVGIEGNRGELGIAIGESRLWGQGIGSVAAMKMMNFASKELGLTIFTAETHEANSRSRKMLEQMGFKEISRFGSEVYLGQHSSLIQYTFNYGEKH